MFLDNYIMITHAVQLSIIETAKENGDEYDFELSTLMASLFVDPELSEYSENELQAAVSEILNG